jgi:hypothetical protein
VTATGTTRPFPAGPGRGLVSASAMLVTSDREAPRLTVRSGTCFRASGLLTLNVNAPRAVRRGRVLDVHCDNAVAPHAGSRFWILLNDNAHDWSRVLSEPDRPHPKIAARKAMASFVSRKLSQIGHERPRGPGRTSWDEPVGDPLDERAQRVPEPIDQGVGVRGLPPRFPARLAWMDCNFAQLARERRRSRISARNRGPSSLEPGVVDVHRLPRP